MVLGVFGAFINENKSTDHHLEHSNVNQVHTGHHLGLNMMRIVYRSASGVLHDEKSAGKDVRTVIP